MCADDPISTAQAARLIAGNAQIILGECANDTDRLTVCVRLKGLFEDYAQHFVRQRTATPKPTPAPLPSVAQIDRALDLVTKLAPKPEK